MIIWYVHGAGASERSFTWLHSQLPDHDAQFFTYRTGDAVGSLIKRLAQAVSPTEPTILIGHSLGGIIAAACAELHSVSKVITLCTPFGGIAGADLLSWINYDPLVHDLCSSSTLLCGLRATRSSKPHLSIVGSQGLPFLKERNDGVVTVASQTALHGPRYEVLPLNHFEVLLSDDSVNLITDFVFR